MHHVAHWKCLIQSDHEEQLAKLQQAQKTLVLKTAQARFHFEQGLEKEAKGAARFLLFDF